MSVGFVKVFVFFVMFYVFDGVYVYVLDFGFIGVDCVVGMEEGIDFIIEWVICVYGEFFLGVFDFFGVVFFCEFDC